MIRLAPEYRALCAIVGQHIAGRTAPHTLAPHGLGPLLADVENWPDFVSGAIRHRVAAIVHAGLQNAPDGLVPKTVADQIRLLAHDQARRGLLHLVELRRLLGLFEDAKIDILVLKGLGLSQRLYGNPFLRGIGDIDLLVDPARFAQAHQIMLLAGYVGPDSFPVQPLTPRLLALTKDVTYRHPDGYCVELHLRLGDQPELDGWSFCILWQARSRIEIQGVMVPTLPDTMQAPYLTAHGAQHCWDRLCWLADLAVLLADPALRAHNLQSCTALGLGRSHRHMVSLLDDWLQIEPGETGLGLSKWRRDWFMRAFFSRRRWLDRPARGSLAWLGREILQRRWRLFLSPHWRHRLTALKRVLHNPVDHAIIALPPRLVWLYPALRPVGWVLRNFKASRRRP